MNIVAAIDLAQEANEKRIAVELNVPKHRIDDTEALREFAEWCRSQGVRWLPAAPATVAAFIRFQHASHAKRESILKLLDAIQVAHDNSNFASPVYTAAVAQELGRICETKTPRWPKAELPLYYALPPAVQAILGRREEQNSAVLRRLQNKVAAAISKPKEIEQNDDQQKTQNEGRAE